MPPLVYHPQKSGLEADQKVIAAHGCYAMTATTALTAQNTQGVYDIHQVPPAFLRKQIDACLDDIGADVVKTGMLASTETIQVVAESLGAWAAARLREEGEDESQEAALRLVLDPVMIATTGAALLPSSALKQLREKLFPLATVVTPNVPEARLLLQDAWGGNSGQDLRPVESVEDLEEMAMLLLWMMVEQGDQSNKKGPQWVLVKGGHTPFRRSDMKVARTSEEKEVVVDVLVGREKGGSRDDTIVRIETEWRESRNTHGTGCSLACE